MSQLAVITLILGILALAGGLSGVFAPEPILRAVEKFPRSVWPGRLLAAVDFVWAALALVPMHLGHFDAWKIHLYWLAPVCIFLCVKYMNDLLSPRALGGLLLLAAGVVLNIARWHPSAWRLVMVLLAYSWIGFGLSWLLEPWWFRRIARFVLKTEKTVRLCGFFKALFGIGLLLLALFVY